MGLFIYLAEWVDGASWNLRFWCVGAARLLAIVSCRTVCVFVYINTYIYIFMCVCVDLSARVCISFVLSSWWSLTRITTRPKLYFLLDSCCCTTFDLRNAAVATLHLNRCSHRSAHILIFMLCRATRGYECLFL